MEVTLRLSPRQQRLLADARDRCAPGRTLESFVALAVAEDDPADRPAAVVPTRPVALVDGLVAPGSAAALELRRGDVVRVEQLVGGQCVDLVAWASDDARERLSASRTRSIAGVSPGLGDSLWSGPPYERPLLALIGDSAPGHDLVFPACSAREYAAVGCLPEPSCVGVQAAAAAAWGLDASDLPDPLNLWLRADLAEDGTLGWHSTATSPGDHVTLLALAPLLVVVNPCVDDVFGCSGLEPRPIAVSSRRASAAEAAAWLGGPLVQAATPVTGVARPRDPGRLAMSDVRVAAVRFGPELGALDANRRASVGAIARAAAAGARLVVLPELASSGYCFHDAGEARAAAETVPGPTTRAWQEAARLGGLVVVGGICELDEHGTVRNSAVVVDAGGVLGRYRKLHLWGHEPRWFVAGDERPPVVETAVGRIGLGVCYDLWFPELTRDLAARGAEIVAVPANFSASPAQQGLPHLDVVTAIATAHVNRVHLVLADRCRTERGSEWLGAALVVDADGSLLAGPPPGDGEAMALADVDPCRARDKAWDGSNDLLADRRTDIYGS